MILTRDGPTATRVWERYVEIAVSQFAHNKMGSESVNLLPIPSWLVTLREP